MVNKINEVFLVRVGRIQGLIEQPTANTFSHTMSFSIVREAAKKSSFFSGPTTKTGGSPGRGDKGPTTKGKKSFFI